MSEKKHFCPVCAWPHLRETPRPKAGGGSFEICPSCGFQFGVSDDDRGQTFVGWRKTWIAAGAPWASRAQPAPKNWDAAAQLKKLGR